MAKAALKTKAHRSAPPPQTRTPLHSLEHFPQKYGLVVDGGCMAPLIKDGSACAFSKTEKVKAGELVVVWLKPGFVGADGQQAVLKRLALAVPPWVKKFPYEDHPESDVAAVLVLEQVNPAGQYTVRCSHVMAMHKYVGPAGNVAEQERS